MKTYNATLKTFRYLAGFYADSVIATSRDGVRAFLDRESEHKCLVIPAAAENPGADDGKTNGRESFTVGLLSDLTPSSDVKAFIRACRLLLDQARRVQFVIMGLEKANTGYIEECLDLKNQLGLEFQLSIHYNNDVEGVLGNLDAIVLGNGGGQRKSLLSRVLQCGRPLVAVKRGGNGEVIAGRTADDRSLGECGLLIESGSPQELARALQVLIDDRRLAREMGKIASRRYEQFYSQSIHLNSFLSLYKNYL